MERKEFPESHCCCYPAQHKHEGWGMARRCIGGLNFWKGEKCSVVQESDIHTWQDVDGMWYRPDTNKFNWVVTNGIFSTIYPQGSRAAAINELTHLSRVYDHTMISRRRDG